MKQTYEAVQVTAPGSLELVERKVPPPGPYEVLIAVEWCGICGADASDVEELIPLYGRPACPVMKWSAAALPFDDAVPKPKVY